MNLERIGAILLLLVLALPTQAAVEMFYLHNDHLGTPRVVTNQAQQVVWKGHLKPFGETQVEIETITNHRRFPGQRLDIESRLHYNYFRDYDPRTGRYIQSDPIGLRGGLNTYAYVAGNPLRFVDPYGLATAVVVGGPTPGNPFGHAAVATTGAGVYSFGTGTPLGSSLTDYLLKQAEYRDQTAYIINTTPEQEKAILDRLKQFRDNLPEVPGPDSDDTCASRSNDALRQAGLFDPSNPYSWIYSSPLPEASAAIGGFYGTSIAIPMGTISFSPEFNQFNP